MTIQCSKWTIFDLCLTVHHECRQNNIERPTRHNNNDLLISKISSTCFGQLFAHLQDFYKTEIYSMWYQWRTQGGFWGVQTPPKF